MSNLYGDWDKIIKLTEDMEKNMVRDLEHYIKQQAYEIRDEIKDSINNQTGSWSSLDSSTVKQKGHSKILEETGQLVESIQVEKIDSLNYQIVPKGEHSKGLSNEELAKIHEYGNQHIPARPFISPIYEKNMGETFKEVEKIIKDYTK